MLVLYILLLRLGHVEVVKLLLSHGANVNKLNNHGDSSLYIASEIGSR